MPVQARVPVHIGGGGPKLTMPLVERFADWWNCPGYALDRLDELRPLAGNARVSVQHPIGLAASAADRDETIATVQRRFGSWGGVIAGTADEVAAALAGEVERGVDGFVCQFSDFGTPETIERFMRTSSPRSRWDSFNPVTTPLVVGVPREVKTDEHRVAITPDGVSEMRHHGVEVLVEQDAGVGSSITDDDYRAAGADIVERAADVWARRPRAQGEGAASLRAGVPAARPRAVHVSAPRRVPRPRRALIDSGTTGVAYETVQLANGQLPLLAPMSEVAGRMAPQIGAHFLERRQGGRGVLLGGAPGVRPARVVVLGAGNVGWNAAWIAQGMEAEVLLLDKNLDRLRWVDQIHKGRIQTLASNRAAVARAVHDADLVIGAVLVPGGRAPVLVTDDMIASMRPGAVIVDCAIDQGGTIEGIHETTHSDPVFVRHGVLHYAVGNVPGAVPNTSTYALTNATLAVRGRVSRPAGSTPVTPIPRSPAA